MMELVFLLIGITALGYYGYVQSDTYLFQAYQSWRLDQLQQGKPATITVYLKQWVPIEWITGDSTAPNTSSAKHPSGQQDGKASDSKAPGSNGSGNDSHSNSRGAWKGPEGSLVGRIMIPSLKLSAIILEGVQPKTLQSAVGHMPGTPLPGESGNVELAAHRDTFFRGLRNVQKGDSITLSTLSGATYDYRVDSLVVVSPNDMDILTASAGPGLNLITCYPFNFIGAAPKRFVVHATEVEESAGVNDRGPMGQPMKSLDGHSPPLDVAQIGLSARPPIHRNARSRSHRPSHRYPQYSPTNTSARGSTSSSAGMDSTPHSDGRAASDSNSNGDATPSRPLFDRVRTLLRKVIKGGRNAGPIITSEASSGF